MPPQPDETKVRALMEGAFNGMSDVDPQASMGELLSTAFTLTRALMIVTLEKAPSARSGLQEGCYALLRECVEQNKAKAN